MKQRSAGKPDIEMGKRIRLRRVEQKISQADLGEQLGVSFQQVQKYEKGVNRVGAARLQQIDVGFAGATLLHSSPFSLLIRKILSFFDCFFCFAKLRRFGQSFALIHSLRSRG